MSKVLYKQGTKATYLSLSSRLSTALYFCTDTRELYKGDDLYTDGIRKVPTFAALPEFSAAADGKLYFCEDSGCGFVLNYERNGWTQVIFGVDNNTIAIGADGLLQVKAIPISTVSGLADRLTEIERKIISGDCQAPIATQESAGIVKGSSEVSISEDGSMSIVGIEQKKIIGLDERLKAIEASSVELKPIAKTNINEAQFEINGGTLNIMSIDAALVQCGEQKLDAVLANIDASITWEEMDPLTA